MIGKTQFVVWWKGACGGYVFACYPTFRDIPSRYLRPEWIKICDTKFIEMPTGLEPWGFKKRD